MARSVSRCPPCAAGSTRCTRPSAAQSMLPDHRSPCSRAGGSGGPASSSIRSTHGVDRCRVVGGRSRRGRGRPAGRARPGGSRRTPARSSVGAVGQRRGADEAVAARRRTRGAPARVGGGQLAAEAARPPRPSGGRSRPSATTRQSSSTASTSGTGAPPASASQASPRASAAKKPAGGCGRDLTSALPPSLSRSRVAVQMSPPGTGVVATTAATEQLLGPARDRPHPRHVQHRTAVPLHGGR